MDKQRMSDRCKETDRYRQTHTDLKRKLAVKMTIGSEKTN